MENFNVVTRKVKLKVLSIISPLILLLFSAVASAQPGSNPEMPSHAEGASRYLQSIETDPNGVPNSSAWFVQPWIWAIIVAILILIIGGLYKLYGKRDNTSETGL